MVPTEIHLINPGCSQVSITLQMQNHGLKHHSFNPISFHSPLSFATNHHLPIVFFMLNASTQNRWGFTLYAKQWGDHWFMKLWWLLLLLQCSCKTAEQHRKRHVILDHYSAPSGCIRTWYRAIKTTFWMNHVPDAGLITHLVDLQSSVLLLPHSYPLQNVTEKSPCHYSA